MALTGLDIFKLLPKTNCGECDLPTCMAFAMKLAAAQAELDACPHVSDEAKEQLSEASAPPIRKVLIGTGESEIAIGEETVQFRHEKTFVNAPVFGVSISSDMNESEVEEKINEANTIHFERVGQDLRPKIIALKCNGENDKFLGLVEKVKEKSSLAVVLICDNVEVVSEALQKIADRKPLIYPANAQNYEAMAQLAKENNVPLGVKADNLEELSELTEKITAIGLKDLVIDPTGINLKENFKNNIIIRRAALKNSFKPLGYPIITFPGLLDDDIDMQMTAAATFVAKYAGIIILSDINPARIYPLLVMIQNIYTDPQKPMQVEEGIYEMNNPDKKAPVLVTTNFSLTYFIVNNEVEGSKMPAFLMVMDVEGLSVLTAWGAGKFVPDLIAEFIKKSGVTEKVSHNRLVIPGYVAQLSGELEDELQDLSIDFKVDVGPREAGDIPAFLKEYSIS